MPLDKDGERLLSLLLEPLPRINSQRLGTFLTYKQIHDLLGLPLRGDTYGKSLLRQGLDSLARFLKDERLPALTGVVVNETTHAPSDGYFDLFGRPEDDFAWWITEVEKSKEFDWSSYLPLSWRPVPPATPSAVDLNDPPERFETIIYRVIRDTLLSRRIKEAHNYECQICGATIELSDGSRYIEAHHIKPLAKPHNGPDIETNIICLCPNHHVQLDYGAIALDKAAIRTIHQHHIGDEFLAYHNATIFEAASNQR